MKCANARHSSPRSARRMGWPSLMIHSHILQLPPSSTSNIHTHTCFLRAQDRTNVHTSIGLGGQIHLSSQRYKKLFFDTTPYYDTRSLPLSHLSQPAPPSRGGRVLFTFNVSCSIFVVTKYPPPTKLAKQMKHASSCLFLSSSSIFIVVLRVSERKRERVRAK